MRFVGLFYFAFVKWVIQGREASPWKVCSADTSAGFYFAEIVIWSLSCWFRCQVLDVLKNENTVVDVQVPNGEHINVCGDVHGQVCSPHEDNVVKSLLTYCSSQFYDLCNIFETAGKPSEKNPYLFNGDFVDRSLEWWKFCFHHEGTISLEYFLNLTWMG